MPRFSICVSSYKDEEYLPACIDSVLAQSFTDFELIVVDDGSPDSTASILEQYAQKDSRVIPLIQDTNRGLHVGRKIAVAKSTGDYIILLDSDDKLGDDCLAKFDSYLNATPCDVLHFGIDVINASRRPINSFPKAVLSSMCLQTILTKASFSNSPRTCSKSKSRCRVEPSTPNPIREIIENSLRASS